MTVRELNLTKLEKEVRGLREFLITELLPLMERMGERKPILIYSLHHPHLKLREPLAVYLEHDGEQMIAFCYDLDVFGYGDTETEALQDLRQTAADLYFALRDNRNELGPLPEKVWDYMTSIVEET